MRRVLKLPWHGTSVLISQLARCSGISATATVTLPASETALRTPTEQPARRRASRRRYSADNTHGRTADARQLLAAMKAMPKAEWSAYYDRLHPRDKLDLLRALHRRRRRRSRHRQTQGQVAAGTSTALPRHRSTLFGRQYFFREEDLDERSALGSGPGGQATNRRMQTVLLRHRPSGLVVRFGHFPSLWLNRRAAREMLNARLEEKLLGAHSELGRRRVALERRRARRRRQLSRLTDKGSVLNARATQVRHIYAFLTDQESLPYAALQQLTPVYTQRELRVSTIFDTECRNWWPILVQAFAGIEHETATAALPPVPELLHYLFPVLAPGAGDYEVAQLEQCRASGRARQNVRRALHCVSELFGLRWTEAKTRSGRLRVVLVRDGVNWLELRSRMVRVIEAAACGDTNKRASTTERLTPLARAVWCWVYHSLCDMKMVDEAGAVRCFFARQCKAERESAWAAEAVAALAASGSAQQACLQTTE